MSEKNREQAKKSEQPQQQSQQKKPPDPQTAATAGAAAELQLYNRIETARGRIYGLVNQLIVDTGLPAVLVAGLVREVATETMLTFERESHRQTKAELARVRAAAGNGGAAGKEAGNDQKQG